MARLRILTFISLVLAVIIFTIKNKMPSTFPAAKGLVINKAWFAGNQHPLTPKNDIRPADQTFLTFPEWFLVFSPKEQADYFETHTSTDFPYMKHIDQIWKGYHVVYKQVKGNYPFNTGYHAMILVIAGSTTVEYSTKSLYETVIGRLTNTAPGTQMTDEDNFNGRYLHRYVNFIVQRPWYKYDFINELKGLWGTTTFFGPHFLRKMERKYYLTTELLAKSGYGWLIKLGTKTAYDDALLNTTVVVNKLPDDIGNFKKIKNIRKISDSLIMVDLPRYAAFNPIVSKLALRGIRFREIAGNNSVIMLTVLTDKHLTDSKNLKILFTQPVITQPGINRIAIVTRVPNLSKLVSQLYDKKIQIEHIYDY